jgi:hypothetical protein
MHQASAQSSRPIQDFAVAEGWVGEVEVRNGVLYAGGRIEYVGPHTGNFVVLDESTGDVLSGFPRVNGPVRAIVADGAGGWYIGGNFNRVGGYARAGLAHILADGGVASWNPGVDGTVNTLVVEDQTMYIGGSFSTVAGQARSNLAAIDLITGLVSSWNPGPDGVVYSMALDESTAYLGGPFYNVNGSSCRSTAAVSLQSGATQWCYRTNGNVFAVALSEDTLYVGGFFTTVGSSTTRNKLAAFNKITGSLTSWDPNIDGWEVQTLTLAEDTIFVGGTFNRVGLSSRQNAAEINLANRYATSWNPSPSYTVTSIGIAGGRVYLGGGFSQVGSTPQKHFAAVDDSTGALISWAPHTNASVIDVSIGDGLVVIGGGFDSVGGAPRSYLGAVDTATGQALAAWDPVANENVHALAVSDTAVYVGGNFTQIDGVWRYRIAAIHPTTGDLLAWNPSASNSVNALLVDGSLAYAGGLFTSIGGRSRARLAAIDVTTGVAKAWNPNPDDSVNAIALSGTRLFAGGLFTSMGGSARTRLAAVDTTDLDGRPPLGWIPSATSSVSVLAEYNGDVYIGGSFSAVNSTARGAVASVGAADPGDLTSWDPNADSYVGCFAFTADSIFVGGAFDTIAGQSRRHLVVIDASDATGSTLLPWDPDPNSNVSGLDISGSILYAVGNFTVIGGQYRSSLAAFCLEPAPTNLIVSNAGDNSVSLIWDSTGVGTYTVYRSTASGGPWSTLGTTSLTSWTDSTVQGGVTYYYTVSATGSCESDYAVEGSVAATGGCSLPPVFEGAVYATQQNGISCSVEVGWRAASTPCGSGSVTYDVHRSTSAGFIPGPGTLIAADLSVLSMVDSGPLSSGETYYYIVRATDTTLGIEDGNLNRQVVSYACPPTQISVNGETCGGSITTTDASPTLEWSNVDNETGYEWQVWDGASCTGSMIDSGSTTVDTAAADATGLTEDAYWWRVKATGDGVTYFGSAWTCGCSFNIGGVLELIDSDGQATELYLEGSRAYIRVTDPWANLYSWSAEQVLVNLTTNYAGDVENKSITETGNDTGIFQGYINLDTGATAYDGDLQTGNSGAPSWTYDTITATYGTSVDTAQIAGSLTDFLDAYGKDASAYPPGATVYLRVRDENINTGLQETTTVTVESLTTGDSETMTLTETGFSTGIFEGSVNTEIAAPAADGVLQVTDGETIRAAHSDANYPTESEDTAVMSSPCNETYSLLDQNWKQIALPCDPIPSTVADVFGDDGLGTYDIDWAMFRRNEDVNTYTQLTTSDTLVQGEGYWIKVISGDHDVTVDGAYADDSQPYEISLVGTPAGTSNQVGHPFTTAVNWAEVLVDVGGGTFKRIVDLNATEASTVLKSSKWEWNGTGYDMCDPRAVCGAPDDPTLTTFDGFWVKAFVDTTLRIPQPGAKRSTSGLGNGEWYVRLTAASADGLLDRSNLLGRLANAADGQDTLDAEELAPFGSSYLVVAFPHDDWLGEAWSYTSDYRQARSGAGGSWSFEVLSDSSRQVTLSWQAGGDAADIMARSWLIDEESGTVIDPQLGGTHTLTVLPGRHRFTWVVNSLPQVAAGPDRQIAAGRTLNLTAMFSDEDTGDTHSAAISWGDGTVDPGAVDAATGSVSGSHVYSETGARTIEVCVTDQAGANSCDTLAVTVVTAEIFANGFESGDTSAWSRTQGP